MEKLFLLMRRTSIRDIEKENKSIPISNSICAWAPTALLPVFHVLGTEYNKAGYHESVPGQGIEIRCIHKDRFYDTAVASIKVGRGVKSEGDSSLPVQMDICMFLRRGGKRTTMRSAMRSQ